MRLVTYAWGRKYVEDLLALTLPGVLAPGNLPALAAAFPCEFVLLTQREHFELIRASQSFRRLEATCQARLVAIDDLVITTSAYGHSLTWTLFRSFEDLGDAVTETNLLFFNADWIPADGSYRSLIRPLEAGTRLIVAPSYCVREESVIPLLRSRMASDPGVLAIAPREMAQIAIEHRHNTVRGKTVNQNLFHMDVMDQFYFRVDDETMLCRQMPIAIVCMRPERRVSEPRTFWDYGTVSELCPTAVPVVLGDSDDFLMIELRSQATYSEGLAFGPPSRSRLVKQLASFTTKDHREYGRHTLVLHSAELPASYAQARAQFDGYVDGILDDLPPPVEHQDHPYWVDMRQFFDTIRAGYAEWTVKVPGGAQTPSAVQAIVTGEVNRIREASRQDVHEFFSGAPFSDAGRLERKRETWRKSHAQLRARLDMAANEAQMIQAVDEARMRTLKSRISQTVSAIQEAERAVSMEIPLRHSAHGEGMEHFAGLAATYFDGLTSEANAGAGSPSETTLTVMAVNAVRNSLAQTLRSFTAQIPFPDAAALDDSRKSCLRTLAGFHKLVSEAGHTANIIQEKQTRGAVRLQFDFQQTAIELSSAQRLVTAGSTHGFSEAAPDLQDSHSAILDPLLLPLEPLRHLLKPLQGKSGQDVLTVRGYRGGMARHLVAGLPGRHFSIHLDALTGTPGAIPESSKFDLCVCDFSADDTVRFREVYDCVAPYMRDGGRVVLSAVNRRAGLRRFADAYKASEVVAGAFPSADRVEVYYSGSYPTAAAIGFAFGLQALGERLGHRLPTALIRVLGAPLSLFAHAWERFCPVRSGGMPCRPWVSMTVCVERRSR